MSIEDRIRSGFASNAGDVRAAVETSLDTVMKRRRRRVRAQVSTVLGAAVLVAAASWAVVTELDDSVHVEPVDPPTPTLSGTYAVDIVGGRGTRALTGTWVVTLSGDGTVQLEPPSGYGGPSPGDGETYVATAGELTTNSFLGWPGCQRSDPPVGRYRFELSASGATFTPVADTCPARLELFSTRWERLP